MPAAISIGVFLPDGFIYLSLSFKAWWYMHVDSTFLSVRVLLRLPFQKWTLYLGFLKIK